MNKSDKITIIGGGAMGSAVAAGLVASGAVAAQSIVVATPHPAKCSNLSELGITVTESNTQAVNGAKLVVLAVKPWVIADVIKEIAENIDTTSTEVTAIVAGVSAVDLEKMWDGNVPANLSIAMPNTAMTVGESMTFVVPVTGQPVRAHEMFDALGKVMEIPGRLLGAATALASCGIAYAMRYVRAACEGGVELGFRASEAQAIVAQTMKGAVTLLEQPGAHPEVEIDKVTTPGGITIRGLNEMENHGFTAAVIAGLKASAK